MVITITFYGPLEHWVGKKSFFIENKHNHTLSQLLEALSKQIGKSLLNYLVNKETGLIKSHFHVLLNGKDVDLMKGLNEIVKDGDTVVCVPPVGGGVKNSYFYHTCC